MAEWETFRAWRMRSSDPCNQASHRYIFCSRCRLGCHRNAPSRTLERMSQLYFTSDHNLSKNFSFLWYASKLWIELDKTGSTCCTKFQPICFFNDWAAPIFHFLGSDLAALTHKFFLVIRLVRDIAYSMWNQCGYKSAKVSHGARYVTFHFDDYKRICEWVPRGRTPKSEKISVARPS